MIELTKHQVKVLRQMATGSKNFATFSGIDADGAVKETIDQMFAESLQLVEYGLVYNVSEMPKFKELIKKYREDEGREFFILATSELVNMMFRRVPWENQIN